MRSLIMTGLALAVLASGCRDLDVANPNDPDRKRALSNADDVELLIASSWIPYWNRTQVQAWPYHGLNAVSGIFSTSVANNGALALSEIPRPSYDNNPSSDVSGLARYPWYNLYSGLDSSNEGLRVIEEGLKIGPDGQDTERARAWAKFSQGLNLGLLAIMFDQAIVATEDTDLEDPTQLEFRPYGEVVTAAVASLEEAAEIASSNQFTIPEFWLRLDEPFTNDLLAQMAHTFAARFIVLSARSPEERQQLDWSSVLRHLDAGIRRDVTILHDRDELGNSNFRRRIQANFFNGFMMDNHFIGKADVSGAFQEWLATPLQDRVRFHIETPDRRVTAGSPTKSGTYMKYRPRNNFRDERGTWRQSYYQFFRFKGAWRDTPFLWMTTDEMDLFRAEALLRTGDRAGAVALINRTRVGNGQLPPVTVDGVPPSADCVPRTNAGQCEDLLGALMYERIMETMGFESPRQWAEARGWGLLYEGTFVHLPVPGRELATLNRAIYTFGGTGPGAAP